MMSDTGAPSPSPSRSAIIGRASPTPRVAWGRTALSHEASARPWRTTPRGYPPLSTVRLTCGPSATIVNRLVHVADHYLDPTVLILARSHPHGLELPVARYDHRGLVYTARLGQVGGDRVRAFE